MVLSLLGCTSSQDVSVDTIKSEYVLVFEDEFNGTTIDTTNWFTNSSSPKPYDRVLPRGNCDFSNAAIMTEENILVKDGYLNLIAKYEEGLYQGIVGGEKGQDIGCGLLGQDSFALKQDFSSATVRTQLGYNHGYFECRAKIPGTAGLYPVLWLWHHDEIVVFEFFGDSKVQFASSHHGQDYKSQNFKKVKDYSDDFHTYAVNWTPNDITWYLDNKAIWTLNRMKDATGKVENNFFPDSLNRWLRPNISLRIYEWAEQVDHKNLPDTLKVDYLKIYQKKRENES